MNIEQQKDKRDTLKKLVLEQLKLEYGNVSVAIENVGVGRNTFYEWKKQDKEFADEVDYIQTEYRVDMLEKHAKNHVDGGNVTVLLAMLNAYGRNRGYGQQRDREQQNNRVTTINIIHSDDDNESNTEQ